MLSARGVAVADGGSERGGAQGARAEGRYEGVGGAEELELELIADYYMYVVIITRCAYACTPRQLYCARAAPRCAFAFCFFILFFRICKILCERLEAHDDYR